MSVLLIKTTLRSVMTQAGHASRCGWTWSVIVLLASASFSFGYGGLIMPLTMSFPSQTSEHDVSADDSEARMRIACANLGAFENKLKSVFELSPDPRLRKQWKKFKYDILDAYAEGVDETRPIVVDVIFTPNRLAYDYRIPLPNSAEEPKEFFDGLRGRGLKLRKLVDRTYEIVETGKKPAHMRIDQNYAWIATGNRSLPKLVQPATADLKTILTLQRDIVVEIKNDTQGIASRRSAFQELRKNWESRARIRDYESQFDFELRKVLQKAMLNEAERLLVEGQQIVASATIDTPPKDFAARSEFSLSALPDTDLSRMIEEFGVSSSQFANVLLHDGYLATSRICIPLDTLSINNVKELLHSLRSILVAEIKTNPQKKTDAQREALLRWVNTLIDVADESASLRSVDTFAELFETDPNKRTLLCGARVADGQKIDEIITLVPSVRQDWKAKPNVAKHADIHIHQLIVGKEDLPWFQSVFPGEQTVHIGVGPQIVWVAAGNDALKSLMVAIDQAKLPGPHKTQSVMASYQIRIGKVLSIVEAIHKRKVSQTTQLSRDQKQIQKWMDKRITLGREAMSECEAMINGELRKVDDKLEGSIEFNECVLRYVGSLLGNMVIELE